MTVFKVENIAAWVITETDGSEGLPAIDINGIMFPFIGADEERINSLRSKAIEIADGRPLKLMRFSNAEVIEQYNMEDNDDNQNTAAD